MGGNHVNQRGYSVVGLTVAVRAGVHILTFDGNFENIGKL